MLPFALPCWGMLGLLAGLWKLAIGGAALGFYLWRKGLLRHPLFKLLVPWTVSPPPTSARGRSAAWTAATTGRPPAGPPAAAPDLDRLAGPAGAPAARRPVPTSIPLAGLARLVQARWSLLLLVLGFLTLLAWVVARWTTSHARSGPLTG